MEKYQTAKEQEVYKSKISFFINLVHEIRTPLSLIRLPLEKLLEKFKEKAKQSNFTPTRKLVQFMRMYVNNEIKL